jgi:hypothetical protein
MPGCLVRNFNVWGTCWDGTRRATCYPDKVYVTRCGDTDGQDWQFVLLGDGETLIKSGSSNSCLERFGGDIELRSCDSNEPNQRFFAPNGSLDGGRFELSQRSAPGLCLNQDHHPKNAEYGTLAEHKLPWLDNWVRHPNFPDLLVFETVHMRPCWQARHWDSLTSYWERA